jgi:outer membrane protein OmpA-like peptidoglycan-associated protein/tetratricopeptide (TPR) repeat protein
MYSIRCVLIFLAVTGLFFTGFGQDDNKKQAEDFVIQAELTLEATKAMDIARDMYVSAANLDPENLKANFEAGHMHLLTIGKDLAVKYFLRVYELDPNYRFDLEYWIAKSYQYGLEFDKAIDFYNRYLQKLDKRPNYQGRDKTDRGVVERSITECENGKTYVSNPSNFSIVNIGSEINSELDDYAAVFNENEDEIVFTSRRSDGNLNADVYDDNKPYEDIFTSKKVNGKWSPAENIGTVINTPYHNSNLALSADGNTLFIYTDDGGGDILYSERQGGTWGEPKPLPGIINSTYEEKSISISKDEKYLYFSSNRPGGFGGLDIYRATKDGKGEWTVVKSLGPKINSEFDDDGPFIDYDGVTLYFSTKGRNGMGGFDIYKSVLDPATNEWSEPENLGYPINTPDNDIYYVSTSGGKRAYYSSVREDGLGYDDIYMITVPDQPIVKKDPVPVKTPDPIPPVKEPVKEPAKTMVPLLYVVQVVDADGKKPLSAKVKLQGLRDNVIVASSAKGEGSFEFSVNAMATKDYRLSVEADGFMFVNETVKLAGASENEKVVTRTVEMRKLQTGMTSILRNVYFDFDKWSFKQETYNELNKLERMMHQNPNMKVEIGGHTDIVGPKNYNIFLSRKRAEAVKDFLTKKGIDARRIKAVGYGTSKPLASNDDENEGRELNRRVEFKVTGN